MRVVLTDLDITYRRRPFPNLALMKLSAYHKAMGDEVYLNFPIAGGGKHYVSSVFTWNMVKAKREGKLLTGNWGGSGFGDSYYPTVLPSEIETIMPDYSLYHGVDFSLGFTSRGCNRACPWCIVPQKEGKVKAVSSISQFWDRRHKKIVLLDNNILAATNWKDTFEELVDAGVCVDFTQGLDIRLVDEEVVTWLLRLKAPELRFAFDDISQETWVRHGIDLMVKAGVNRRRLNFYVLYGWVDNDKVIDRLRILGEQGVNIYPMAYRGLDGKIPPRRKIEFADQLNELWHGSRGNINKFLRISGRLPE